METSCNSAKNSMLKIYTGFDINHHLFCDCWGISRIAFCTILTTVDPDTSGDEQISITRHSSFTDGPFFLKNCLCFYTSNNEMKYYCFG